MLFSSLFSNWTLTLTSPPLRPSNTNSFFVLMGDRANEYIPVLGTGSNEGQGHHGVVGYSGGMLPNITNTFNFGNALNTFVRASGNLVLPVELMSFDVE